MKSVFKPTVILTVICLIVTAAVAGVYAVSKSKIEENDLLAAQNTMAELISDAEFSDCENDGLQSSEAYVARQKDEVKGYIFVSSAYGYGGNVKVMTAVATDGKIIGVRVLSCDDETPGLGQNAKKSDFTDRFTGLDSHEKVDSADAITSATFTTKAVKKVINTALDDYLVITGGEQ